MYDRFTSLNVQAMCLINRHQFHITLDFRENHFSNISGIYIKPMNSQSTSVLHTSGAGDLASGRAFDNGCLCRQSSEAMFNDLTGREVLCSCGVGGFLI